jgi:hypothetical protein
MIVRRNPLAALIAAVSLCSLPSIAVPAEFTELLAKLPPSSNTLVMLNAEQIFGSEVATQGGWKQNYEKTYADAPLLLPPGAQQFVLAADLDLPTMKPRWESAVVRLADDPSMNLIARTVQGSRDTVGGLEAIATARGGLVVKFGPHLFGMMRPASRQSGARWVREAGANSAGTLSPYLKAAAAVPDQVGTEIIMAIDLTDALNRDRVRQALANSAAIAQGKVNPESAADILAGIQGATLGARVTRRVYGKLKIDFARDVAPLAAVAKPLLLEVLAEAGASIDEFEKWNVAVTQRQIAIDGELTASGLRRLFSFLELDATALNATADSGPEKTNAAAPGAAAPGAAAASGVEPYVTSEATLKYFQAVTRHIVDLRNEDGAKSYASIALWFDKYARRIDRLPIMGVDKDMVDYGQFVVGRLRDAVDAIRGVGIRSGAQTASVSTGVSGYSDYYVFDTAVNYAYNVAASPMNAARADVGAAEAQRRAIRATERAQGTTDARAVMRDIDDKTSAIKRQMTERYNIEFTAALR